MNPMKNSPLNENDPLPLYHQLYRIFRENIERNNWKGGERIPPEAEFCHMYQVSRGTVAQALKKLEAEGFIYRKQGKGSFVNEKIIDHTISGFYRFATDMQARGKRVFSQIITLESANSDSSLQEKLNLTRHQQCIHIERIRYADHIPLILENIYLLPDFEQIIHHQKDIEAGSIYDLYHSVFNHTVKKAVEEYEVVRMNASEAAIFSVDLDFPALLVRRHTFNDRDIPFEYRKSIVRADQIRYRVELHE